MKQKFLTTRKVMLTILSVLLALCLAVGIALAIPVKTSPAYAEETVDADAWDGTGENTQGGASKATEEPNYVLLPENAEDIDIDDSAFGNDTYIIAANKEQYESLKDTLTGYKLTYIVTIRYYSNENIVDKEARLFGMGYGVYYDEETDSWITRPESEMMLGTAITSGLRWYLDGSSQTALTVSSLSALLKAEDCGEYIDLIAFDTGVKAFIAKDDIVYDGKEHKLSDLNSLLHRMSDKITDGMNVSIIGFNDSEDNLPESIKDVGVYTIFVEDGNAEYTFTLTVNCAAIDATYLSNWKVVGENESSELNSYNLYIYTYLDPSKSGEYYPSIDVLSADRIQTLGLNGTFTTRAVVGSVVRNHNADVTVALSESDKFTVEEYEDTYIAKDVGVYTASVTLSANANYQFLDSYSADTSQGLKVTVNEDGTVTVSKVWYIVNLSNWLVNFSVPDFVYGTNVTVTNPTPYYQNTQGRTDVSITLSLRNQTLVSAADISEHPLSYYINGAMPAGTYTLTVTVGGVYYQEHIEHTEENQNDHTNCPVVWHSGITETFTFTVEKMGLPGTRVNALNIALRAKTFTYIADGSSHLYDSETATAVRLMLNANITVKRAGTFWASASMDGYYGGITIDYNLLGMHSDAYLTEVDTSAVGLYTVYYRISAPNYYSSIETLTGTQKRQDFYFTVINFGEVAKPATLEHKLYTGSALTADVPYSPMYEIISNEGGINAGTYPVVLSLTQPDYYMWAGQTPETKTATCEINFVIDKADNDWIVSPTVIAWEYGRYNSDTNLIMGSVLAGEVSFRISTDNAGANVVPGLDNITLTKKADAEYYVVSDSVKELLYGLDAATYYLIATVTTDGNHSDIAAQTIPFTVTKAANDWRTSLNIITWQYGEYDAEVNRIFAATEHGTVKFKITQGTTVIVEDFEEIDEEIAQKLKELPAGSYTLTAKVTVDNNHAALQDAVISFTVTTLNNDWLVSPSVIQWQYGVYDAETHLILGKAKSGEIVFKVTDMSDSALTDEFSLTEGIVPDSIATILSGLAKGDYKLLAKVVGSGNFTGLSATAQFSVNRAVNTWEQSLGITTWMEGKYKSEENVIEVKAKYGDVIIRIVDAIDTEKAPYYEGALGTDELKAVLSKLKAGNYMLTATVEGNEDYSDLVSESILFKVFEQPGLAWWVWLLIIVGILGVIALVFWILHEKGVLQMLTSKFIVNMRTKMTVDATIAAVRANLVAEESRKSREAAERREREAMEQKAREEGGTKPAEEKTGEEADAEQADESVATASESTEEVADDNTETDGGDTSGSDTSDEN